LTDHPGVDGIYFDEMYPLNLPESYRVIRTTRKILGSNRRIIYHSTVGPTASPWTINTPGRPVYSPTVDAYADFVATGELAAQGANTGADQDIVFTQDYLRYRISGYNISNSIGLDIDYFIYTCAPLTGCDVRSFFYAPALQTGGKWLFESRVRDLLRYNARMPYREGIHYSKDTSHKAFYESLVEYWKREPADETEYRDLLASGLYASVVLGHRGGQHVVGDFDGDSKDDIAFLEPGDGSSWGSDSLYIRTHTPNTIFPPAIFPPAAPLPDFHPGLWHPFPGYIYEAQVPRFGGSNSQLLVGDFDGNGSMDFASLSRLPWNVSSDALVMSTLVQDPDPSRNRPAAENQFGYKSSALWGIIDSPRGNLLFIGNGHFSGDKKADFVFFDLAQNKVLLCDDRSCRSEDFPYCGPPYNYQPRDGTFYIGDFDGNGGDDLAFLAADNSMHIAFHFGATFEVGTGWGPNMFGHKNGRFYIGDFDGDRRSDFAFFEPADTSMHILLNEVSGFVAGQGWPSNVFGNRDGEFLVGDLNGDGRSDFAFIQAGPALSATPYYTQIYTRLTLDPSDAVSTPKP